MKVSNKVTLLGAAVAALFATAASAQLVLPSSNPTVAQVNGKIFARELSAGTQLGGPITVSTILGIGMSGSQDRYVKITLANATFNSALTNTNFAVAGINAQIAIGGQAATSSVIYQLTSTAGNNINDAAVFNMATGVNVTSTASAATVTYEVYEFLNQANASPAVTPLYSRNATIASFSPAVALTNSFGSVVTSTASAASSYLNVSNSANATTAGALATRAVVGSVVLAVPSTTGTGNCTNAPCLADGVTAATIGAIVNTAATTNSLSIAGDFGAASSAASVSTALVGETASAITGSSATLPLLTGSAAAVIRLRYALNGTTALPVSTYSTTANLTAQTGYTVGALGPVQTGFIDRDGSQLDSPWVTATPGFISRFFLLQTTPAAVPYTVTVRNAAGLVTGGTLTGSLVGGRLTQITMASLLPADTTAFPGPYQVTFNIAANLPQVQGTYVLTAPNGSVSNTPLYTLPAQ
jgi:hypothetical protein